MILFELRCSRQHHFEAWFRDGATYESQAAAGAITCPVCGDTAIGKAPMAPRLLRDRGEAAGDPGERAARALRSALREIDKAVRSQCDYVGDRFPEEARRIHYGECAARPIYGEATRREADDLREEGVEIVALPRLTDGN